MLHLLPELLCGKAMSVSLAIPSANKTSMSNHEHDQVNQAFWDLKERLDLLIEDEDGEDELVTLLVELLDGDQLDLIFSVGGAGPVLYLRAKTSDFDISEIEVGINPLVAEVFRNGRIMFMIENEGPPALRWRSINFSASFRGRG